MVSAVEAALESPQLPPEARDRIHAFLRLYRAAGPALEEMRADVFVRRLIERIGLRRHQLFAASPETAYRLVNLSRLGEVAAAWTRREPRASTRDFVRYLTAVAEAGGVGGQPPPRPRHAARVRGDDPRPPRARARMAGGDRPRVSAAVAAVRAGAVRGRRGGGD